MRRRPSRHYRRSSAAVVDAQQSCCPCVRSSERGRGPARRGLAPPRSVSWPGSVHAAAGTCGLRGWKPVLKIASESLLSKCLGKSVVKIALESLGSKSPRKVWGQNCLGKFAVKSPKLTVFYAGPAQRRRPKGGRLPHTGAGPGPTRKWLCFSQILDGKHRHCWRRTDKKLDLLLIKTWSIITGQKLGSSRGFSLARRQNPRSQPLGPRGAPRGSPAECRPSKLVERVSRLAGRRPLASCGL